MTPPGSTFSTFVEARTADVLGDQRRAARLYASLSRVDPANRGLARRAIASSIESGELGVAVAVARSLSPAELTLDSRLLLVADALRRGKEKEALALVEQVKGDDQGAFAATLIKAWTSRGGASLLERVAADDLLGPFANEQRAAILLSSGRVDEALPLIPKALAAAAGRETRLRLGFAALLARAGRQDEARALLVGEDPALRRINLRREQPGIVMDDARSGFAELLLGLAAGLARGEDGSLPLALVQIARHAAPANGEAAILAALLLDRGGRDADALAALDSVGADDPFIEDALDSSARLLLQLGRAPEALARASAAATGQGAGAGDFARLGNVLGELDRHTEAAAAFARAAALADTAGSDNRWTYRLLQASQLDQLDRWPEARALIEEALKIAPDQPLLLNYLGYGSLERGENLDRAEAMIRRALALRPGDSSITDSLGWALYKRGRLPEAIETLRSAAASQPAESEIHEHLGDALYRAGRRYEARFAWAAALVTAEAAEAVRLQAKIKSGWTPSTAAP